MSRVFVVGALHLDVVVDAPRLPQLDETLMGDGVAYRFGGKGGNQALAAARMGAQVAIAGRVGQDSFATPVLAALDRAGLDRSQVRQGPGATGMSVAIVEQAGEYGAVVVSGVNRDIRAQDVDAQDAAVILLQNEIPEAVNADVIKRCGHAQIVLNAAPARPVPKDILSAIDLLVVNRIEAAQITQQTDVVQDPQHAAQVLHAMGPRAVVLTLGVDGAVICDSNGLVHVPPPAVVSGSAHGAGDAFVGALAAEIARGEALLSSVRYAAAAAAHFVQTHPDAREAIIRADVDRWLAAL